MCIALSCLLCHCVSCLDLIKYREAALSIPFACIFPKVFPVIILHLANSQNFSRVVLELFRRGL